MEFITTKFEDLVIVKPQVFGDARGYFFESFNQDEFNKNVQEVHFIQDNESRSKKGVLRGLHFQNPPYAQAKLVRCIKGEVLDVVVDVRKKSKTYGESFSIILSEENKSQLFVPRGFAHGFAVLSSDAVFSYKVDNQYKPDFEDGIIWNDKDLGIDWKLNDLEIKLSGKDILLNQFSELKSQF